jgi:hypothetical protein
MRGRSDVTKIEDMTKYYVVTVRGLRWEQGRLGELRDDWQKGMDLFPRAAFARAWLSLADAEPAAGDDARRGPRALAGLLLQRPQDDIWQPAVALAAVMSASVDEPEAVARVSGNLFRREGEFWTVRYEGSVARFKDGKGLRYLAQLLGDPGREFHAVDLGVADGQTQQPAPSAGRDPAGTGELAVRPDLGDAGELLDATAKAAYKARLGELAAELEEAERFSDPGRTATAVAEREFLVRELARAVGLGGRDRRAASHAERARLNVTRAIRTAMANLARANPALGRHLAATIRTGRYCSYTPDPRAPITWEL